MSASKTLDLTPRILSEEPDELLVKYCRELNKGQPALDLRAGLGANCFFLADKGFRVDAIEEDMEIYRELRNKSDNTTLPVQVVMADFADFRPQIMAYSAIIALGIIPELSPQEVTLLIQKIAGWTLSDSYVLASGLTVDDPSFAVTSSDWRKVGRNSFTNGRGKFRSYMEPGQVQDIFDEFKVIEHWEGEGPEQKTESGETFRSGLFKTLLRK
jgi:cyclopropane fatty-acyl-phospholipid synthase-like methyltransferase